MNRSRPRVPGMAYMALMMVLLALVAAFALTSRQPPPPSIAEFAPQSAEQITDAPDDQTTGRGRHTGSLGVGVQEPVNAAPTSQGQVIDVPRVRKCVGDPPRQIEDPQSPPCVPYWSGENGGATSKGVTRDEVRIAVPSWNADWHPVFAAFFNKRFEFYGRSMRLGPFGSHDSCDPAVQQADAVDADESARAFASLHYSACGGYFYFQELARRRVIGASEYGVLTEAAMAARRPYLWQYPIGADEMFEVIGRWVCARLAGSAAVHAGDAAFQTVPRKFGVVLDHVMRDQPIDARPLESALAACGVSPAVSVDINSNGGTADYPAIVLRMKNEGVTSVICLCLYLASGQMAQAAVPSAYFPEWLLSSYLLQDDNWYLRSTWPTRQLASAFGLTFKPRQVAPERQPVRWAQREASPNNPYGTGYGAGDDGGAGISALNREYRTMLLIASGIQMAGPALTPTSFEAALQRTRFPNPVTPEMAGAVGFGDGDHSMTDDAAEFWWSTTDQGPYADDSGTLCYVDAGVRRVGGWPRGTDPFFAGVCDAGRD